MGYALVAPATVERFGGHDDADVASEGRVQGRPIVVTNPLSSQHSVMRQELLGGLLEVVGDNQRRGREGVAIFEIGSGYGATDEGAVHGWWRLGFALTGPLAPAAWDRATPDWELGDGKGLLELLASSLGLPARDLRHPRRRSAAASRPSRPRAGGGRDGRAHRRAAPDPRRDPRAARPSGHRRAGRHRRPVGWRAAGARGSHPVTLPDASPGTWPSSSPTTARPPRSRRPSGATPARSCPT